MVRVGVLVVVVFLIAGAVPALSASSTPRATVQRGVTLERDTRSSGQAIVPRVSNFIPPLRVPDPLVYAQKKAQAERGYQSWLRTHGDFAKATGPSRLTSVAGSGSLNQPGVDSSSPSNAAVPPDTTGAAGPSNYVEMVNSEIAVYSNSDLTTPTATVDAPTFTGDTSPCDGQIQWDEQGQRWLYTILGDCFNDETQNYLYFGWSKTTSPDLSPSNWCQYTIQTGQNLEDYPKLGHDDSQILIGTNEFGNTLSSKVYVFDKPAPGDTSCPSTTTEGSTAAQIVVGSLDLSTFTYSGGFTPVAVNLADSSATGYVVATEWDSNLNFDGHLDVYAIGRNAGANALLGSTSVSVPAFCVPPPVSQQGTTDTLDSLDGRLTQAVATTDPSTGQEGIWTQHTIAQGCNSRGISSGPSVVRWYELTPGATTPTQVGTVNGPNGSFAFMGAISPSSDGQNAAIFYNSSSSSTLPDFRVQDRHRYTTSGQMIEDLQLATSGYADTDGSCSPCRWGDYTGASPDPSNPDLIWGSGELTVLNFNPLLPSPQAQWGTENAAIDVTPAANYSLHVNVTDTRTGSGSVSSAPAGVDACTSSCSHDYAYNTPVQLTATPAAHSVFKGWSGDCSGTGACNVPMGGPQNVTATFAPQQEDLDYMKSGTGSGNVSSAPPGVDCSSNCSSSFDYGASVQLTAVAAAGSVFTGWSGDCSGTGACNVTMTGAHAVTATFVALQNLSVTLAGAGSGSVSSSPAGISCGSTCSAAYMPGASVELTATPAAGSAFTGWSGDCTGSGACDVTMSQARSVTATFVPLEQLTVAKSGSGAGSVASSPAGISCGSTCDATYTQGSSVQLTAAAAAGSVFKGWSGACSGTGACNVTMSAAESVTATFAKIVCVVPAVDGKKLSAAKTAITNANCSVGTVTKEKSKTVKKGDVISQTPAPRKHLADGARVSLVVSKGK